MWEDISKKYEGKPVLGVGHSNTIPGLVNYLVPGQDLNDLDEGDFSSVFFVRVEDGQAQVLRLSYAP